MFKKKCYKSPLDDFLDSLKTTKIKQDAIKLRNTWWDQDPNKINQAEAKSSEIDRNRYSYY